MSGEEAERATVLDRIGKALFPERHLAPWMGIEKPAEAVGLASLRTIADVADEIDRRGWLDKHRAKKLPEEMQKAREAALGDPKDGGIGGATFDRAQTRGAAGMFGFCLRAFSANVHDLNPSVQGVARRQAISVAVSQRTGVAVEPKERSRWERWTGRGKDKDLIGGTVG